MDWISVEDQLPEKDQDVVFLVITYDWINPDGFEAFTGYIDTDCDTHELHFEDNVQGLCYQISGEDKEVYYWCPLPEFPKITPINKR